MVADKEDELDMFVKATKFAKELVEESQKKMKGKSADYNKGFVLAINFYVNITKMLAEIGAEGQNGYKDGTDWVSEFALKFWGVKKSATVSRKKSKS